MRQTSQALGLYGTDNHYFEGGKSTCLTYFLEKHQLDRHMEGSGIDNRKKILKWGMGGKRRRESRGKSRKDQSKV
jgi:hypothetical protein